jgi:hypothetical protein
MWIRNSTNDETYLMRSENSSEITTLESVNLHVSLEETVNLNATDRIVIKIYANIVGGGATADIILHMEGEYDCHVSIIQPSASLGELFVSRAGSDMDGDLNMTNANIIPYQNGTLTIGNSTSWWYGYFSTLFLNGANIMSLFLPITGGTLTGNLLMGESNLTINGSIWGRDDTSDDTLLCKFNKGTTCANGETATVGGAFKGIWHFEKSLGNPVDDSGNNNLLTNSGAEWNASGRYGNALTLVAANNDYIYRSDDADFDIAAADSFTAGLWVRTNGLSDDTYERMILKQDTGGTAMGYIIASNDSNYIIFRIIDSGGTQSTSESLTEVYDQAWHHVVAVRDVADDELRLYIDGVLENTTEDTTTNTMENNGEFLIGTNTGHTGGWLNASVDDVFFTRDVLTADEIKFIYDNQWHEKSYFQGMHMQGYFGFTGESLLYTAPSNIDKTQGTIEMWVYPIWDGDDSTDHRFLDCGNFYGGNSRLTFRKTDGDALNLYIEGADGVAGNLNYAVSSATFPKNTWHYIAASWDFINYEFKLYLNGDMVDDSLTATVTELLGVSSFQIGRDKDAQQNEAQALIDELRVSYRPLTDLEVKQSYEYGLLNRTHVMGEA